MFNSGFDLLVAGAILFVVLWMLSPQEFIASDPWIYSQRAYQVWAYGEFGRGTVFDHRLALIVSTAAVYKLFGVSIRTTNIVPLLSGLLVILTVWLALPDRKSKFVGLLICLTSLPLLKASIALYPDIVAASFMALSFYLLLSRQRVLDPDRLSILIPIAAVIALFIAFLAKETAYWVIPLWVGAIAVDLRSANRNPILKRFYLPALLTAALIGTAYLLATIGLWNDAFSRLRAIEGLTGKHLWSWSAASNWELLKRLTIEPIRLLVNQYTAAILSLALLSLPIAPRTVRPWAYYAFTILMFWWFGSTSFSSYEPLPLVQRMTLPLLPPMYILAAYLTSRLLVLSERPAWMNTLIPTVFVIIVASAPLLAYVNSWRWTTLPEETAISLVMEQVVQNPDKQHLLLTSDLRSSQSLSFFFEYRYPDNLRVSPFGALGDETDMPYDTVFIFIHTDRSTFLWDAYGDKNYDAEIDSLSLPVLFQDRGITLIRIDDEEQISGLSRVPVDAGDGNND